MTAGVPREARERGGHPDQTGAALHGPPQLSPPAATPLPPCPAAPAARLPVTCGRREQAGGWLRHAGLGPSTHSLPRTGLRPHEKGPETGQQTGLQFLRRHHRGARTRNRARAAAQVMLRSGASLGVGAREARASRLLPAAYSGCKETCLRVFLARPHRCPSFNVWVFSRSVVSSFPPESKMATSGFRQVR